MSKARTTKTRNSNICAKIYSLQIQNMIPRMNMRKVDFEKSSGDIR